MRTRGARWTAVWVCCSGLWGAGCIVEAPTGAASGSGGERRQVVAPAPPLSVRVGANLGGKVELASAMVAPGRVLTGEPFRVTLAFRVLEAMEADYSIFVHVDDVAGRSQRLNADHAPVGGRQPTSTWQVGDTVRDEFLVHVPPGMPVRALNLFVGLWDPKTDARLPVKNPDAVRTDGNDRLLIAQVPVGP